MTDPNIALQVGRGVTPIENPLEQAGKALSIRGMMQQQQAGALGLKQQQIEMDSDAAGRKLFTDSLASGVDPTDSQIMGTYGATKGAAILKNRVEARKLGTDLQESQGKIAVQQADYAGSVGRMIDATGNDPTAFLHQATAAIRDKHIDPALAQPYIDHVQQLLQTDPEAAKKAVAQITQAWMAKSAAQTKLTNEGKTADSRVSQAQTGATRLAHELPGIDAGGVVKEQEAAGQVPIQPFQAATLAGAAEGRAETARHNLVDEKAATGRLGVEQGQLALARKKNEMEYGAGTTEFWVHQLQDNPDSIKELPPALRSVVGKGFTAATGLPLPTPLGATAQASETAARNALDGVAFIRQALQNPEIQKQIGPIMGRLGNLEQRAGTAVGLSPEAEQLAQELRTRMRYFVFQEGKAVLGGRLPAKLMEALESNSANVKMDGNMLEGALRGAEGSANSIMDNADKARFGGKMRSREMRGQGSTKPAATPEVTSQADYDKLPKGAKYTNNGVLHVKQ